MLMINSNKWQGWYGDNNNDNHDKMQMIDEKDLTIIAFTDRWW